jgi:hypothetical protein
VKGLTVGQQVDLLVAERETLGARIDETRDDALRLTLLAPPPQPIAGSRATLHFTNRRGVCSIEGELREADRAGAWFTPEGRPRLIQRREHVRVEATIPVAYSPDGQRRAEVYTLDVSGGGFVLGGAPELSVGGTTHFTLLLGDEPLEVFGTAVRVTERGGLAINIDVIAPGARERLIHWIFKRERLARAYARGV